MKPYVGMTVQYYPRVEDEGAKQAGEPLAAIVAAVWSDACVNLTVFDGNGRPYSNPNTSVTLYPHSSLKDGREPGCAYMLPVNGMLESEMERIEEENERLSKSNQDLMYKLAGLHRQNDELREASNKRADYLSEVCKILGGGPDVHATTVAELAKARIGDLSEDNKNLTDERNRLVEEIQQLSEPNQELGTKLVLSQQENVEFRRVNDKMADSLAVICETLGGDRCDDAPTVAESAKGKIENLEAKNAGLIMENCRLIKENKFMETLLQDLRAICNAGGRPYSDNVARVMNFAGPDPIRKRVDTRCQRPPVFFGVDYAKGDDRTVQTVFGTRSLESSVKYRAHAKVMRSYDYNHFEISLSCDDLSSLAEVDELRKSAARLAEKGVEQYQKAKDFERWKANNQCPDNLSRETEEIKGNYPQSEWTPEQKAKVKKYHDRLYWLNRDYDYEDEFDWESETEEDGIPV